jgi:hypothetical protein
MIDGAGFRAAFLAIDLDLHRLFVGARPRGMDQGVWAATNDEYRLSAAVRVW